MNFEKIWKTYNTSLVLILPIFKNIIAHIRNKYNQTYSIHGLFIEYGLINTYLYDVNGFNGTLKLLFDRDKLLDCNLQSNINTPINNLLDLIINSEFFYSIIHREKHIMIELKIPEEFLDDIKKIELSKYSKVSEKYKEQLVYNGSYILTNDDTVNYLYIENIPIRIAEKRKSLEKTVKELFNTDIDISDFEYYNNFNIKKETYHDS